MKICPKCGTTNPDDASACSSCQFSLIPRNPISNPQTPPTDTSAPRAEQPKAPAPAIKPISFDTANDASAGKLVDILGGTAFLVAAILVSVHALSFDVCAILLTIFAWIAFASAKKGEANIQMMRCISGTVFACMIVSIVSAAWNLLMVLITPLTAIFTLGFRLDTAFTMIRYLLTALVGAVMAVGWGLTSRYTKALYQGITVTETADGKKEYGIPDINVNFGLAGMLVCGIANVLMILINIVVSIVSFNPFLIFSGLIGLLVQTTAFGFGFYIIHLIHKKDMNDLKKLKNIKNMNDVKEMFKNN